MGKPHIAQGRDNNIIFTQNTLNKMECLLLNGRYNKEDAELLLAKLFKVKTEFHISKINTSNQQEEDMKHSEARLKELDAEMRKIKNLLKQVENKHVELYASVQLGFLNTH